MKMMAIGIAKQAGAERCHDQGFKNMAKNVPLYGKAILKNANILFAVPTLENAYDETCKIVAVNHDEVEEMEPPLPCVSGARSRTHTRWDLIPPLA